MPIDWVIMVACVGIDQATEMVILMMILHDFTRGYYQFYHHGSTDSAIWYHPNPPEWHYHMSRNRKLRRRTTVVQYKEEDLISLW